MAKTATKTATKAGGAAKRGGASKGAGNGAKAGNTGQKAAAKQAASAAGSKNSRSAGPAGGGKSLRGTTTEGAGGGGKRRLNPALSRPVTPDEELSQIVGAEPLPRPQVVKRLWDYIKAEGLQDTENRRLINADEKLRRVFDGKKKVNMFEMTKLVSAHIQ